MYDDVLHKGKAMVKDVSVTLRMSEELKNALQELAVEDRRSLSSYIEMVLERHCSAALEQLGDHSARLRIYKDQSRRHLGRKKGKNG